MDDKNASYDEENQVCWDSDVAPTDEGSTASSALTMLECNDCTLTRLIAALQQDPRVGLDKAYKLPAAPFSEKLLDLNIVGLRIKNSVSNKFDDCMYVFYRPVDLESATKVHDPESPSLAGLNVKQIEALLADKNAADLKVSGDELPGKGSTDEGGKECTLHHGWKVLKFSITTDPGYEKKPDPAKHVAVGGDSSAYLAQGRASLRSGRYTGSHRLGVHHWSALNGFTAMAQIGNLEILRGYTAQNFIDNKLKPLEKSWEKEWKAYFKKHPTDSASGWIATYVAKPLANVVEVREKSLSGTVVATKLDADYVFEEVDDPKHPGTKINKLTVNGLKMTARAVAADDVLVVTTTGNSFGINMHSSNADPGTPSPTYDPNVFNWSEGCQVYKGMADFQQFRRLVELSKRARCTKRNDKAATPCPSLKAPKLETEDVVFLQFANSTEMKPYTSTRLTSTLEERKKAADDLLRAKLTGDELDKQFITSIQGRVDAITFDEGPATGPVPNPKPVFSTGKTVVKERATALKDVVKAHLLPDVAYDKTRTAITTSALEKKFEAYVKNDVEKDADTKAKIDAKVALLAKGVSKKTVLADAEVIAAVQASETASKQRKLTKLASELDKLTAEVKDKADFTIADAKAKRSKKADQWNAEGWEVCDFMWSCGFSINYTLAEVDESFVKDVDKRWDAG